jgi:hypothetical protein
MRERKRERDQLIEEGDVREERGSKDGKRRREGGRRERQEEGGESKNTVFLRTHL